MDVKVKTFFQIPPRKPSDSQEGLCNRVVFMDIGFNLDDLYRVSEPVYVRDLQYAFHVRFYQDKDKDVMFEFKRKGDCVMAQRELLRAWTRTGEFAYAVDAGVSGDVQ